MSSAAVALQLRQLSANLDTDKSGGIDAFELATAAANSTGATADAFVLAATVTA